MRYAAALVVLLGAGAGFVVTLLGAGVASAGAAQPRHPVYVIYDGFIANADGSLTLAFGYYNVNRVEVTVAGDGNAFLQGAADRNQPTVFLPGRQRFACVMVVPEAFDGRLQWRVGFAGHESVTTERLLDPPVRAGGSQRPRGGRRHRCRRGGPRRLPAARRTRRSSVGPLSRQL